VPVADSTNASTEFRRNAIREEILPLIESHFPGADAAIARLAFNVIDDSEIGNKQKPAWRESSADGEMSRAVLLGKSPSLAAVSALKWLRDCGVDEPTRERAIEVVRFCRAGSENRRLEVGSGRWVVVDRDRLRCDVPERLIAQFCLRVGTIPMSRDPIQLSSVLDADERRIELGDWWIALREGDGTTGDTHHAGEVIVSLPPSLAVDDLSIRPVRPGDVWFRSGKPVRESLRAARLHPLARWSVASLANNGKVLVVPGVRGPLFPAELGYHEILVTWGRREVGT
jgi:hypothetical protein